MFTVHACLATKAPNLSQSVLVSGKRSIHNIVEDYTLSQYVIKDFNHSFDYTY